jgi:hypothetical protein
MLRYATIEEAWQRSTPQSVAYPADQGQHSTLPEILDPPAEAPVGTSTIVSRTEARSTRPCPQSHRHRPPKSLRREECVETGM